MMTNALVNVHAGALYKEKSAGFRSVPPKDVALDRADAHVRSFELQRTRGRSPLG